MKLPDIDYSAPVQSSVSTAALPFDAAAQSSKVIAQGLQAYGQELVKTEHQRASTDLVEKLNQVENAIKAKKEMTQDELRATFGDQIPPQAQGFLDKTDPLTGKPIPIPMWAIGDALYQQQARKVVDEVSGTLTMGQGWTTAFRDSARAHVVQRQQGMAEYQLRALDSYLQHTQAQTIDRLRNAGAFDAADRATREANALPFEVRQAEAMKTEEARQERPALDALNSTDPVEIKKQADRLRSDPAAAAAIHVEKRKQIIGQLDARWQKFEAVGIAQQAFAAGRTEGTLLLDEQKVFAALQAAQKDKLPSVQKDAHELLKQQIADFNEQRKTVVNRFAAEALAQFMTPGQNGQPRMSTALVDPVHRAFLNDPGNGLEAPKFWESLVEKERQLRQLPTDEQAAHLLVLESYIRNHQNEFRKMTPDQLNDFAAKNFPKLPVPYWNRVNDLLGQIRNPQAPVNVISEAEEVTNRLKEAGVIPASGKVSAGLIAAKNALVDEYTAWLNERKAASPTGQVPTVAERGKWLDEKVSPVEVERKWLPFSKTTTKIEAQVAGEKRTLNEMRDEIKAALQRQGVANPTEDQILQTWWLYEPKPPKKRK